MAKLVKINGFEIKVSKKDIQTMVDAINNALENNENIQSAVYRTIYSYSVVNSTLFNDVFWHTTQHVDLGDGTYGYSVTNIELKNNRTIYQMVEALTVICDELIATYNDVESVDKIISGYRPNWFIKEEILKNLDELNYILLKECYKNIGVGDVELTKKVENSVIANNLIVKEYVKRNGIRDLFVLIRKFCGNIVVVYNWQTNSFHSIIISGYTFNQTHANYRTALNTVILLDLIYLALYELETITIASEWVGTNEFDLMPDDLEKRDFTVVWFNFWLRCFIKDFLKVCKIQIGLLNHKLNKEIKQNECVTSYAEYLFYLKNKVKQDYYRIKGV